MTTVEEDLDPEAVKAAAEAVKAAADAVVAVAEAVVAVAEAMAAVCGTLSVVSEGFVTTIVGTSDVDSVPGK